MTTENKCCGNCRNFSGEDIFGNGICLHTDDELHYTNSICQYYEPNIEGWTEITPDNVEELYESKERVCVAFVCNGEVLYICGQFGITLSTMAKHGGYYYFVLPELKIE